MLDTDIVSASSPTKAAYERHFVGWVEERSVRLYLSAVTIAEITTGTAKLKREHPGRRAKALAEWLESVVVTYGNRVLPVDVEIALGAGKRVDLLRSRGHQPGLPDAAIAATAIRHGLTVVTRNTRHFRVFDVPLLDPFDEAFRT
nr:type II toxin-antitoxin system VapC family toxin [Enterovirga sp. DB1703]